MAANNCNRQLRNIQPELLIKLQKETKKMDTENQIKTLKSELEQPYAPEFIGTLADNARETLYTWLVENGAPKQALSVLNAVCVLGRAEIELENHTISKMELDDLKENLGEYSEAIAELGGIFYSPVGSTGQRENVIEWQPTQPVGL